MNLEKVFQLFTENEIMGVLCNDSEFLNRMIYSDCPGIQEYLISNFPDFTAWHTIVSDENCPVELLEKLTQHSNYRIRLKVASHPKSTEKILMALVNDSAGSVCEAIYEHKNCSLEVIRHFLKNGNRKSHFLTMCAENPYCDLAVMNELAREKSVYVREALVKNVNCPIEILEYLSKDKALSVREAVVENVNCPIEILEYLSKDEYFYVRRAVAKNSNCSKEILKYLSKDDDYRVRIEVARNINCTEETLQYLAKDDDYSVRMTVASNINCSEETLQCLAEDENYRVRMLVEKIRKEV